jgi:hypothetical protein
MSKVAGGREDSPDCYERRSDDRRLLQGTANDTSIHSSLLVGMHFIDEQRQLNGSPRMIRGF